MATQSRLPAFLLTRPMAQSLRFADELQHAIGRKLTICISPVIAPVWQLDAFRPKDYTAALFTSETGVAACQALLARGHSLPETAFCVGDRTAKAALALGFKVTSAQGDAAALIAMVQRLDPKGPLLHLCGHDSRGDVANTLCASGVQTDAVAIYRQVPQDLTAPAAAMLAGPDAVAVPLFSPRSALLFCQQALALRARADLSCFALSPAVAAALDPGLPGQRFIAEKPNSAAMIAIIQHRFAAGRAS